MKHKFILVIGVLVLWFSVVSFSSPTYACETEDDTDAPTEEPEEDIEYSNDIIITELLPNPSGTESTDEFIELYNDSGETVDLAGWLLSDATTKMHTLDGSIGAGQYMVVYREVSSIALNNSGDIVELYNPNEELVDEIEYISSVADDESYSLENDEWYWTMDATPGRSNNIINDDQEDGEESDLGDEENSEDEEVSDSDEESSEETEDEMLGYEYSTDIILSELLPDPEGSDATDEWIELTNTGSSSIDLYGWQIGDPSKTYTIQESTILAGGEYRTFMVTETSVSLNNSGDTIWLYDPAGDVMDDVTYEDGETGASYAWSGSVWDWTSEPTPDESNTFSGMESTPEVSDSSTSSRTVQDASEVGDSDEEISGVISIAAAKQLPKGEEVIAAGIVNVLPGVFGSQYFYIQDDTSGVQIYSSKKDFPDLVVGDYVQVTGKVSEANGEKKINISVSSDIVVQEVEQEVVIQELKEYDEVLLGSMITTSGEVEEKSGSSLIFDTEWVVYIKRGTEMSMKEFSEGDHLQVQGILTATNDGIRIFPRSEGDITSITAEVSEANSAQSAIERSGIVKAANAQSDATIDVTDNVVAGIPSWMWLLIGGGALVGLILLSRSEKLSSHVRNFVARWVRGLAARFDQPADLGKNTKDSKIPIPRHVQYHENETYFG